MMRNCDQLPLTFDGVGELAALDLVLHDGGSAPAGWLPIPEREADRQLARRRSATANGLSRSSVQRPETAAP